MAALPRKGITRHPDMFARFKTAANFRWIIVAAGGLLGCIAMGAMFSLPVFLLPMARDTGWSVTGISAAMTIGFLSMALCSMAWGSLSDRFGPRLIVMAGSLILAASLALASQTRSLIAFQIMFGIGVGGAAAAIFAPMMACVTGWFDTHRSLAVSLVSAGMGMAPLTMSPLAARLLSSYAWRDALLIIAILVGVVTVPVALLVRRPPAAGANASDLRESGTQEAMSTVQALKSPQFFILLLTNFFCCATHSGPIIHTVSYAITCGIPMMAAVSIYSVEGLAGLAGRICFGVLGDHFGAKRILVSGLLVQAIAALGYDLAGNLAGFYAAAALFGFVYAGIMPLYAVIIRENFPLRLLGTVIGGAAMAGSLGMATGPLAGGLIYDAVGSYRWLYIASCGMGIGAFLVALMFRPNPQHEAVTASA